MKDNKKNIILDLDNTLISSVATEDWDKKNNKKAKLFPNYKLEDIYIIFERPHLQEFLDYLFANFNVSIWTAATLDYALFIIDNIILKDKERKIDYIFYYYHCKLGENKYGDGYKHLDLLFKTFKLKGYNKSNTLIIDDLKDVYDTQPCNCINIDEFEFTDDGSEKDNALDVVLDKLKVFKDLDGGKECLADNF